MLRRFSFKDTATGTELVLPVTPKEYQIAHGRKANSLTLHQAGDINLPGNLVLLDEEIECLLPAHDYAFNLPGASTNPFTYLEQLEKWSDAGTVLRFIVSGTPVNAAVTLDPIRYREQDGTNDIYCVIPLRGYRQLAAETVQSAATGNAARTIEAAPHPPNTYTVKSGDTLSAICRKYYGDASLYGKLAAANGISNPNLIRVGQVLKLPDASTLPAAVSKKAYTKAANSPSQQVAAATVSMWVEDTQERCLVLTPEQAMEIVKMGEGGLKSLGG